MKLKYVLSALVILGFFKSSYSFNPLNVFCWKNPWPVTECKVSTIYEGDENPVETSFIPAKDQNVGVDTCYKIGCHPMYCSDWRESIGAACKKEYQRQQKVGSRLSGQGTKKKISSQTFEGCAVMPEAEGFMYPIDLLARKTFAESWFSVCSTDTPEKENAYLKWAKEHASSIVDAFKSYAASGWEKTKGYAQHLPGGHIISPTRTSSAI